jgi:hypothetical protein
MFLVLCFRLYSQIAKSLVYIIVAELHMAVNPYVCCNPPISMGRMLCVYFFHKCQHLCPFIFIGWFPAVSPFVISGAADAHEITKRPDIIFLG